MWEILKRETTLHTPGGTIVRDNRILQMTVLDFVSFVEQSEVSQLVCKATPQ